MKVHQTRGILLLVEGKNDDGTYKMDHLMRVQDGNKLKWKHPLNFICSTCIDILFLILRLKGIGMFLMKDLSLFH